MNEHRYLYVKMKTFTQTYKIIRVACSMLLCILRSTCAYLYKILSTFHSENRIRTNINMYSQMLPLTVMNPVEFVFSHEHTLHWLWDQRLKQVQAHMLQQTIMLALEMVPELVPMIDFVAERLLNILKLKKKRFFFGLWKFNFNYLWGKFCCAWNLAWYHFDVVVPVSIKTKIIKKWKSIKNCDSIERTKNLTTLILPAADTYEVLSMILFIKKI